MKKKLKYGSCNYTLFNFNFDLFFIYILLILIQSDIFNIYNNILLKIMYYIKDNLGCIVNI